jgi:hypothetical protein
VTAAAVAVPPRATPRAVARGAALAVLVLALGAVHLRGRPATFCLLRGLTGIPCPLCGGTTAAVQAGHGRLLSALRSSPLAVFGAGAFVLAPTVRRPHLRPAVLWTAIGAVAAASEVWQLLRFGLL